MAAFPTTITPLQLPAGTTAASSSETWLDDLEVDRAVGGGARVRAFYPTKKRVLSLHFVLDATGRTTLESFYDANRLGPAFTITSPFDGVVRTVLFGAAPILDRVSPALARAQVVLVEQ